MQNKNSDIVRSLMPDREHYSFVLKDQTDIAILEKRLATFPESMSQNEKLRALILAQAQTPLTDEPVSCLNFSLDPKDSRFCYCKGRHITLNWCLKVHKSAVDQNKVCSPPYLQTTDLRPPRPQKHWCSMAGHSFLFSELPCIRNQSANGEIDCRNQSCLPTVKAALYQQP